MAYKSREEIVGKRFLSVVSGFTKLKIGKISEWGWRAGVIRAATHKDNNHKDLQVLVEYDDVEWHRREWISIYKDSLFHLFMVEQALCWADRTDPFTHSKSTVLWPALTFVPLVSTIDLTGQKQPVEFLLDRELSFADYKLLKPFQEWDGTIPGVREYPELRTSVRRWVEQQDGQRILLATPSVLVGYRVEVYRAEGTTQWYTAVIVGYNEATRDLTVTDDTVLEEHNEDPALVQIRLIGDGVVESIMRGENVGITPRRSRSAVLQTQHLQQTSRIVRGLSGVNQSSTVSTRKPRTGKPSIAAESILQTSPEPPDKGLHTKNVRKRKTSENESTTKLRSNAGFCNIKEDLENKQGRKKNGVNRGSNKKKVLEEANNSKLRDLQVRVEDCLQNAANSEELSAVCRRSFQESVQEVANTDQETTSTSVPVASPVLVSATVTSEPNCGENDSALDDNSNGSSVQLVTVEVASDEVDDGLREVSVLVPESVVAESASEEDDCVIVAQRTTPKHEERECSSRGDDDGPLSSSSPFSRMELTESASAASLLRFPDDRSDSGVSSLRSGSGDERSGSRSSALSSSDEPQSNTSLNQSTNRSPLFIPSSLSYTSTPTSSNSGSVSEPVRVWRDPSLLLESEPHVRHIHSVQHQTLLMSHPSTPAASGPPPTSAAATSHPSSLYPPVPPPPNIMSPHPLQHHHLPPPGIYSHHMSPTDMLSWKSRHYSLPVGAHLMPPQAPHPEELLERERAYDRHERMMRQTQESREMEKHKEREKERERQERDKIDREREREKHEQEREKQRCQQEVQKHFEESLKRAQQKDSRAPWNIISMPPPIRGNEDDRKRVEHEMHQREQQRHMPSNSQARVDARDRAYYAAAAASQRPMSVPSKGEYPPPAHSRVVTTKSSEKMSSMQGSLPKAELNMYGYPAYQPTHFFSHEPKSKGSEHHKLTSQSSGLVVTKSASSGDRDMLPNPPPLMSELKNSVIVKHDGKNPHHLEPRVSTAHSPSPKMKAEMMSHYLPGQGHKSAYDYRSPTQSPHHMSHAPSPHHLQPENLGKSSHYRSGQLPSPHHQRHSPHPHPHAQPHPSPEMRYRSNSESQVMIYPSSGKSSNIPASYPYMPPSSTVAHYTAAQSTLSNSKPKVSSPAPHHFYGKPSAGIGSGIPPTRPNDQNPTGNPLPLTSKPLHSPSPFQQASQYNPPHPQSTSMPTCLPPPAHSSRASSAAMYDRMYAGNSVPGGLSVKPTVQHGTSPPTAASAPSPVARSHSQYMPGVTHPSQGIPSTHSVQTQPLDLGVSSNKYDSALSPKRKGTPINTAPVCLEKKRRIDAPNIPTTQQQQQQQQQQQHQQQQHQQQQQQQQLQQHLQMPQQNLSIYGSQPQLARVSEPSPLIASAATTITTVVNTAAYRGPTSIPPSQSPSILSEVLPDVSVTAVNIPNERPPSLDSNASSVVSNVSNLAVTTVSTTTTTVTTISEPTTPIKLSTTPSAIDSEKSNSPVPTKSANYPVRHLKKAWLQRHTGEDVEDTTGIVGSGSCVTLPLNINNTIPIKEAPPVSLHSIGSMAVNSINKTKTFQNKTNNRKVHKETASLNGHPVDASKADDSSSSDQERGRKSPPKRKPPKVKRKKGGGAPKKTSEEKKRKTSGPTVVASESGSDSDKESVSDKDSDSGASTTVTGKKTTGSTSAVVKDKEPRKRGRRPKTKNDKGEEPRTKKSKDELVPQRDPFRKPPVGQLKKTGESFLQYGPCFEVAPKLAKCRECRWTPNQRSKNMPNIFCRFYAFRRLRYTKNGQLAIAGFSDPHKDAVEEDLKLWLPSPETPPADLDLETSRFILKQVGDHFCNLLVQEKDAHSEHMSDDKTIAWKRVVQGVREMCDVCETTLFNFHWACGKCGFVVCLDCYKGRKTGTIKIWGEPGKDRDDFSWLLCTNRQAHEQEKLMLTQIIAGDSLTKLGKLVHEMRELWNVEQHCGCAISKEVSQKSNGARKEIIKSILSAETNGIKKEIKEDPDAKPLVNGGSVKDDKSGLTWFAEVALSAEEKKNDDSSDSDENFSTLRELLIRPSHKPNGSRASSPVSNAPKNKSKSSGRMDTLDEVISSVIEESVTKNEGLTDTKELKHFVPRDNALAKSRGTLPIRIMTLTESKLLYPDTPHSWLCDGKLLRLSDSKHPGNYKIFQDQWKRGQPVLVSDVSRYLDKDLWSPEAFARDFGDEKNDLVNCINGSLVVNQPMRKFWEGFEHFSKRLKDERGNQMLLKLKDWPPGEDFADMLPTRYADLMKVLPLSEYTHRNGRLNLASRLPDCFIRPDLGPKMYNAYGSALYPSKGTTNLHLDISDAVNVMVYVGILKDSDSDEHIKEAFRAIDEAGCDILTRRRVRDKGELPGALWHIYNARDADKIRDLLNKVVVEKGGILKPNHDPIHDQSCYLDGPLRERLYKEYGVEGYAIVQCLGDAVFIPAGAPHQVRNLHNCIKVAEDFVSPENVSHCFHLTQEFRDLSDTHSNHEDKLQIKNIISHAVKDSLSSLTAILNKHIKTEKDSNERNGNSIAAGGTDNTQNTTMDSSEPA